MVLHAITYNVKLKPVKLNFLTFQIFGESVKKKKQKQDQPEDLLIEKVNLAAEVEYKEKNKNL